jgi:hypothetical protein
VALNVNAFAIANGLPVCPPGLPTPCTPPSQTNPTGALPLPLIEALCDQGPAPGFGSFCNIGQDIFNDVLQTNQNNRCPGSLERDFDGSNPYIPPQLEPDEPGGCDPKQVPLGP